jgi:hypothetical protein
MLSSSKAHPCPICSRDNSDHCRFDLSQGVIFCFHGVSHGPPDLRIGDTLDVEGVVYAYVKDMAGFSGNSAMFRIHEERDGIATAPSYSSQLRQAAVAMQQVDRFQQDAELADHAYRLIIGLPLYEQMKPAAIREAISLCRDGSALLSSLVARAYRLRRHSPDVEPVRERMVQALKEVKYQEKDLHSLWHNVLLDPAAGTGQRLAQWFNNKHQQNISSPL